MRATYLYGAGDVRVIDAPDPKHPAAHRRARARDPRLRVRQRPAPVPLRAGRPRAAARSGHELIGVVEEVGAEVTTVAPGDFVIAPFAISCGSLRVLPRRPADLLRQRRFLERPGPRHRWRRRPRPSASRSPTAPWSPSPASPSPPTRACWPRLLTLSDVYGTGWHAAVRGGGVTPGSTVTVIGDGAVGLLAVLSAKQLGAERIVLMGRHQAADRPRPRVRRHRRGRRARRPTGSTEVRDLTDGGSPIVLEAVGHLPAYEQALGIVRPGGVISRVGVPQYEDAPVGFGASSARTSP